MRKSVLLLLALAFSLSMSVTAIAASGDSSCIKCHTDEAALKSQFIPPMIKVEEGEG
jgi:hypothetical protein